MMKHIVLAIFVLIIFYFLYGCMLYLKQETFLFFPTPYDRSEIHQIEKRNPFFRFQIYRIKDYQITFWESTHYSKNTIIFYFGGNAENTNYTIQEISSYPILLRYKWVLLNYPGYNGSNQKPSEKNFYIFSSLLYEHIIKKYSSPSTQFIAMGRSIGSGVASYLASVKKFHRLILITPFDSIETIARIYFPFYPVSLLLKHKFPSYLFLKELRQIPILLLLAENDEVIPEESTNRLLKHLKNHNNVIIYTIPRSSHNTISNYDLYWQMIQRFLEGKTSLDSLVPYS